MIVLRSAKVATISTALRRSDSSMGRLVDGGRRRDLGRTLAVAARGHQVAPAGVDLQTGRLVLARVLEESAERVGLSRVDSPLGAPGLAGAATDPVYEETI